MSTTMTPKQSLSRAELNEITSKFDITFESVRTLIEVTKATGELDSEEALPLLNALFTILKEFEVERPKLIRS